MKDIRVNVVEQLTVGTTVLEPGVYVLKLEPNELEPQFSRLLVVGSENVQAMTVGWWYFCSKMDPPPCIFLEGDGCLEPVRSKLAFDAERMRTSTYRDNPYRGIAARHT